MNTRTRIGTFALAALTGSGVLAVQGPGALANPVPDLPIARTFGGNANSCDITRTEEYPVSSPEAVGLDSGKVKEAIDFWTTRGSESVKVFRHGCLVGESGRDVVTERIPRQNWSQTKTVNSLVAGIAVSQGLLKLSDTMDKFFPAGIGTAKHRSITVRDALNMTTGVEMDWVRGLNFFGDISRPREAMAAPMAHEPGSYFWYDQTTPSLVTYAVQQALIQKGNSQDYQEFAQEELFNKLGIPLSAYWWQRDRSGNTLGFSQLFLRPLEFGRLGELMRRDGVFAGERLINKAYMKELRTGQKNNCGNSLMVWINGCKPGQTQVGAGLFQRDTYNGIPWISSAPSDMYFSFGYHGQHTFVIPSLDMVITRSGEQQVDGADYLSAGKVDNFLGAQFAATTTAGYFNFFDRLMKSVTDMTDAQRGLIKNTSGAYDGADPLLLVDPNDFDVMEQGPGSYFATGSQAPQGCTLMGCEGERNQGDIRWMSDVPRTFPGVIGQEQRPKG
jgi:CubicO group peptidase (beta-lactamase class C family)